MDNLNENLTPATEQEAPAEESSITPPSVAQEKGASSSVAAFFAILAAVSVIGIVSLLAMLF